MQHNAADGVHQDRLAPGRPHARLSAQGRVDGKLVCNADLTLKTMPFPAPELRGYLLSTAERIGMPMGCAPADGERLWEYVKQRVKETGLRAMRTKAGCFRICTGGPWLVVYPDGIWYGAVTPERFERILQDHLLGGEPVSEWLVARNDFGCAPRA